MFKGTCTALETFNTKCQNFHVPPFALYKIHNIEDLKRVPEANFRESFPLNGACEKSPSRGFESTFA